MNERFCGINIGINGIIGSYLMIFLMNWEEMKLIVGPTGNIIIIFILLFYFVFTSIIFNTKNISNISIQFVAMFYGALLCSIIVKPIKYESWKLYVRLGTGFILLFMTLLSLVIFILK